MATIIASLTRNGIPSGSVQKVRNPMAITKAMYAPVSTRSPGRSRLGTCRTSGIWSMCAQKSIARVLTYQSGVELERSSIAPLRMCRPDWAEIRSMGDAEQQNVVCSCCLAASSGYRVGLRKCCGACSASCSRGGIRSGCPRRRQPHPRRKSHRLRRLVQRRATAVLLSMWLTKVRPLLPA